LQTGVRAVRLRHVPHLRVGLADDGERDEVGRMDDARLGRDALPHGQVLVLFFNTQVHQGCQIFLGTKYQNGEKYTKLPQTIPNVHKI
jgi:hypothetical protein